MSRTKILDVALSEFGIAEIAGAKDNPRVLQYFDDTGFNGKALKDETSWCSAFINWVALEADALTSGKLTARSWLNVGEAVETPTKGDVVIFWRESRKSWKGHVGIFIRETPSWVYVLGGNQNNRVCIQAYRKKRVLGYRDITKNQRD